MFGFFAKKKRQPLPYDHETLKPCIRCSICTGEQVAGFMHKKTREFRESMLIRNEKDLEEFKEMYGIEEDLEKIF